MLCCDQHPQPDIELALADKQWLFNILLQHKHIRFHCANYRRWLLNSSCCSSFLCWRIFCGSRLRLLLLDCNVVGMCEVLELFGFSSWSVFYDKLLKLFNWIKEVDAAASVSVCRFEQPHVVSVKQSLFHCHTCILPFLFGQRGIVQKIAIQLGGHFLFDGRIISLVKLLFAFFDDVEVMNEFVEVLLTQRGA